MRLPATAKWVLLALLGLAIAIGVAIAASDLAGRQIGIASESVSAGDALAPALRAPAGTEPGPAKAPTDTTTTEQPQTDETTEPDDHGGERQGSDDHGGPGGGSDSDGDDD